MDSSREYDKYIKRLRRIKIDLDENKAYSRLTDKIEGRRHNYRLITANALTAMVIILMIYSINMPGQSVNSGLFSDYIFQQKSLDGDSVLNYVFEE